MPAGIWLKVGRGIAGPATGQLSGPRANLNVNGPSGPLSWSKQSSMSEKYKIMKIKHQHDREREN